jgi:hypothetical protein
MSVSGRPRCAAGIIAGKCLKKAHPYKNCKDGPPELSPTGGDVVDAHVDVYYDLFPV